MDDQNNHREVANAVRSNNINLVQTFIDTGQNVDTKSSSGQTPLHWAARFGHTDIAKILIAAGSNVNNGDDDGTRPLHNAVKFGHKDTANLIIEEGAEINGKDESGETALHIATEHGNTELVENLVSLGATLDVQDNAGRTPLHRAYQMNKINIVNVLIQKGAKDDILDTGLLRPEDYNRENLLLEDNITPWYSILMQNGARDDILDKGGLRPEAYHRESSNTNDNTKPKQNKSWMRGIYHLFQSKAEKPVPSNESIAETSEIEDIIDEQEAPPNLLPPIPTLMTFDFCSREEYSNGIDDDQPLLELLGGDRKEWIGKRSKLWKTAVYAGYLPPKRERNELALIVKKCIDNTDHFRQRRTVRAQDKFGTVLMHAAARGLRETVSDIILAGGTNDVPSALRKATEYGYLPIVHDLLKTGYCSIEDVDISTVLTNGNNDMISFFIGKGMNVNEQDRSGITILYHAVKHYQSTNAKNLITSGANVNLATNEENWTPLLIAAKTNQIEIVRMLIDKGADVEAMYNEKFTALNLALFSNNLNLATELILLGVNLGDLDSFILKFGQDERKKELIEMDEHIKAGYLSRFDYAKKSHAHLLPTIVKNMWNSDKKVVVKDAIFCSVVNLDREFLSVLFNDLDPEIQRELFCPEEGIKAVYNERKDGKSLLQHFSEKGDALAKEREDMLRMMKRLKLNCDDMVDLIKKGLESSHYLPFWIDCIKAKFPIPRTSMVVGVIVSFIAFIIQLVFYNLDIFTDVHVDIHYLEMSSMDRENTSICEEILASNIRKVTDISWDTMNDSKEALSNLQSLSSQLNMLNQEMIDCQNKEVERLSPNVWYILYILSTCHIVIPIFIFIFIGSLMIMREGNAVWKCPWKCVNVLEAIFTILLFPFAVLVEKFWLEVQLLWNRAKSWKHESEKNEKISRIQELLDKNAEKLVLKGIIEVCFESSFQFYLQTLHVMPKLFAVMTTSKSLMENFLQQKTLSIFSSFFAISMSYYSIRNNKKKKALTGKSAILLLTRTTAEVILRIIIIFLFLTVVVPDKNGEIDPVMATAVYYGNIGIIFLFNIIFNKDVPKGSCLNYFVGLILNSLSSFFSYNYYNYDKILGGERWKTEEFHQPTFVRQGLFYLIYVLENLGLTIAVQLYLPNLSPTGNNHLTHDDVRFLIIAVWTLQAFSLILMFLYYATHPSSPSVKNICAKNTVDIFGTTVKLRKPSIKCECCATMILQCKQCFQAKQRKKPPPKYADDETAIPMAHMGFGDDSKCRLNIGPDSQKKLQRSHQSKQLIPFRTVTWKKKSGVSEQDLHWIVDEKYTEDIITLKENEAGLISRPGATGKFYCGRALGEDLCSCCDGCGPTNGCNCAPCQKMDIVTRKLPKNYYVNGEGAACRRSTVSGLFHCGRKLDMESTVRCGPDGGEQCQYCQLIEIQVENAYRGVWRQDPEESTAHRGITKVAAEEDVISTKTNEAGQISRPGATGKFYCGGDLEEDLCSCCDGCGPTYGCNCAPCQKLDIASRKLPKNYYVNREGAVCRKSHVSGLFHCGRKLYMGSTKCCGPDGGQQCQSCHLMGVQVENAYMGLWSQNPEEGTAQRGITRWFPNAKNGNKNVNPQSKTNDSEGPTSKRCGYDAEEEEKEKLLD